MFTLRLQRQGKKKDFVYRVVAIDSRFSVRSGKAREILGWWNPKTDKFNLNKERINHLLKQGIQPTDSCYNLLVKAKIISGPKRKVTFKKKKEEEKEETKAEEKTQGESTKETKNLVKEENLEEKREEAQGGA
ncbi:MAG: 30S ribosomal protein S16 [Minisyncoccia bacterium]